MWFSFWRSGDRFSLDQLRYLTDQLVKVQIVNDVNKDFVIEAIRSIAELIIWGDQNGDSTFFELFMEKQIVGEFIRVLKTSGTLAISFQLLQSMSILIQNLKKEHAIYYLLSNKHMNLVITYSFDFQNQDLLSYYISFLRAISGTLDKNTISLLVKTRNDEIVSFPLYVEAMRFAFHEESMIQTAVRNLTLNIYIAGDESVNRYVTSAPCVEYFLNLVTFFRKQCIDLNRVVSDAKENPSQEIASSILDAVHEIEDNLYYFSDIISAGILDVGILMTDNLLLLLIFPILLPSLTITTVNDIQFGAVTSLYLLCCILRIVKIKDLANVIAAALFCPLEAFLSMSEAKLNGCLSPHASSHESEVDACSLRFDGPNLSRSSHTHPADFVENDGHDSRLTLSASALLEEVRGIWPDLLIIVLCDEWKKCKRAIEASSPWKELESILLSSQMPSVEGESSFTAGERMCESVKVFVLLHQLQTFSLGRASPDQPPINPPVHVFENGRAKTAGIDASGPKPGSELKLVNSREIKLVIHSPFLPGGVGSWKLMPCLVELHLREVKNAISASYLSLRKRPGGVVLAEELPLKQRYGVVCVAAPLAGSNPRIDIKHPQWLHLRIRPSTLPFVDPAKSDANGKVKTRALVDGRWTLAFRDDESCKSALSMVLEEISLQSNEVERRIKPLLDAGSAVYTNPSSCHPESSSSHTIPSNSL